jgi:superfamily II DNA/RNA helicase
LPADREQCIHRLGRTGRKGKEGQGIVFFFEPKGKASYYYWLHGECIFLEVNGLSISEISTPLVDSSIQAAISSTYKISACLLSSHLDGISGKFDSAENHTLFHVEISNVLTHL